MTFIFRGNIFITPIISFKDKQPHKKHSTFTHLSLEIYIVGLLLLTKTLFFFHSDANHNKNVKLRKIRRSVRTSQLSPFTLIFGKY